MMKHKSILSFIFIASLFIIAAYFVQTNKVFFIDLIGDRGLSGLFVYTFLAVITTVIAPLSSLPLMPIAAHVWGPLPTVLASILGWWIGSLIAFYISRKYGRGLVEKLFSKEKIESLEKKIPYKNLFWSIVILRIAVPVDVLSYVLGLFSSILWRTYAAASLIGIIPFAFIFAYAGILPIYYQIIGILIVAGFFIVFKVYKARG